MAPVIPRAAALKARMTSELLDRLPEGWRGTVGVLETPSVLEAHIEIYASDFYEIKAEISAQFVGEGLFGAWVSDQIDRLAERRERDERALVQAWDRSDLR